MRIFNIEITRRKQVRDAYQGGSDSFVSRWARPPSMNTAEWLNMFSTSPRLAVVDRIASDLANISGKLMRVEEDGTEVEVTSHPFLDFMNHPNPLYEMTSSAIWRLHEIYLGRAVERASALGEADAVPRQPHVPNRLIWRADNDRAG